MKRQKSLSGIRCVFILFLTLTLISGYTFAQIKTQFAYTANPASASGVNYAPVSIIRTLDDSEKLEGFTPGHNPHGIAITDQDDFLFTAGNGFGETAVFRINTLTGETLGVMGFPTFASSNFVAITPRITTSGGITARFAYVTGGSSQVHVVNADATPNPLYVTSINIAGAGLTQGVAVATRDNGTSEVWVTDASNENVYVIDPVDFSYVTLPPPPPGEAGPARPQTHCLCSNQPDRVSHVCNRRNFR